MALSSLAVGSFLDYVLCSKKVGLKAELFAGHSFHIGAATTVASAGLPGGLIQAMRHWNSVCYKHYVRITNQSLQSACTEMVLASSIW